ncbi:MAG: hypothetical protein EA362_03625 [Saprospirales bacterium]|nr:MAG: hypothetical protein EA362_03625 [Saprospirales bacterium]
MKSKNNQNYQFYYYLGLLLLVLSISIAFLANPLVLTYNFHISVFIIGLISPINANRLMNRWIIPSVLLLTSCIFLLMNPENLKSLNIILRVIIFLPIALLFLHFSGLYLGNWLYKKFPLIPLALLVFLSYLTFLFTVQDHMLGISFWVIFSFIVSYFSKKSNLSLLKIIGILSIFPINSIVLVLLDAHDFFWDISIPSFLGIAMGIFFGIYIAGKEKIGAIALSLTALPLLLGIFGLPILSKNISNIELTSVEILKIEDVPFIHQGDTLSLRSFEGKILVLDFWHSRCAVCFEKFPNFEKLKDEFQEQPEIVFFAINSPIGKENPGDAAPIIDKLGYSFENLYLLSHDSYRDFGVQYFPTLVIINREQTEIIRTSIERSPMVVNNSYKIIQSLLDK